MWRQDKVCSRAVRDENHKLARMREVQRRQKRVTVRIAAIIGQQGNFSRMEFSGCWGCFVRSVASLQF